MTAALINSADQQAVIDCIRAYFGAGFIALHEPQFDDCDIQAVVDVVKSTFVSSVGKEIGLFEQALAEFTGVDHVVAVVNGTAALHAAMLVCGVRPGDEVITQSLTFVATCNAIRYCQAEPVFIDVDDTTLGLSPAVMRQWLEQHAKIENNECINRSTGRPIRACVPMHTFGHPVHLAELVALCNEFCIELIEDAAEGLGSFYGEKHVGSLGRCGTLSFNGNKIITTGGGGAVMTNDAELAAKLRHITTTAKVADKWASYHDQAGYNYRMPNLNAGLGLGQIKKLSAFITYKRELADYYRDFFSNHAWQFLSEPLNSKANYWLNAVLLPDIAVRDAFVQHCAEQQIQVRPAWEPMHRLPMFDRCQRSSLAVTEAMVERLINLPSSPKAQCATS